MTMTNSTGGIVFDTANDIGNKFDTENLTCNDFDADTEVDYNCLLY